MTKTLKSVLSQFINQQRQISHLYFANNQQSAPLHAYQVDFPRIELIIEGEQLMQWADSTGKIIEKQLEVNDLLYITANSWCKPIRSIPITCHLHDDGLQRDISSDELNRSVET